MQLGVAWTSTANYTHALAEFRSASSAAFSIAVNDVPLSAARINAGVGGRRAATRAGSASVRHVGQQVFSATHTNTSKQMPSYYRRDLSLRTPAEPERMASSLRA